MGDLTYLKAPEIPGPQATDDEILAWAKKHKVSVFVCGSQASGEQPSVPSVPLMSPELKPFVAQLQNADLKDDALFARLVRDGMDLLRLSDRDVADEFDVSRPTVTRWRNGENSPHPAMRRPIYRWFIERARGYFAGG